MIKLLSETKEDLLACKVSGNVDQQDYEIFNPALDQTLKNYENPKMYLEIEDLKGFEMAALWEDLKNVADYNKFSKIAIVGDKNWEKLITKTFDPIIDPKARFFNPEQKQEAINWLSN